MADKSSDKSDADQTTVPGSRRLTAAVTTRLSPTLILPAVAKELVILTVGSDRDNTNTFVEAVVDRLLFETSTVKIDAVFAVSAEEYSGRTALLIAGATRGKLQF